MGHGCCAYSSEQSKFAQSGIPQLFSVQPDVPLYHRLGQNFKYSRIEGSGLAQRSVDVQLMGSSALANACADNEGNRVRIGDEKAGGIETIVKAIENHAGSVLVQEEGRKALQCLGVNNATNRAKIEAHGFSAPPPVRSGDF